MLSLLKSHFGHDRFLPLQEEVIANVLGGRDALVLMPTGGGKSLCYQLPALRFDGLTLVISPLIALMKDQVDALQNGGIAAEFINSTLPWSEVARVRAQATSGRLKILYVAPERLATPGFQAFMRTLTVSLIAIDEAHCISEWGHDFRPDYRNLRFLRRHFPDVPVIALTATATPRVREDIVSQLELESTRTFVSSFNRPNLTYNVQPKRAAFDALSALLRRHRDESAIVYCFSRRETEELASRLSAQGLSVLPYHAGLDSSVRRATQDKFVGDEVAIVVATIAFGMGIDKPDIRLVVHYDLPKTIEGYYQETGRAGRDGQPSECVLFYSYQDKHKQDFFIDQIEDDVQRDNVRHKLAQVVEFCDLQSCRRRYLMEYFGEAWPERDCGGCDVCLTPTEEFDATEIAQKVLSAVIRTGQRFGATHVIQVLRGAKSKRILELGHDRLTVYGIVQDFTANGLKDVVDLLVAKGVLEKTATGYPVLRVTPTGQAFLKRGEGLFLMGPKADLAAGRSTDDASVAYDQVLYEKLRTLRNRMARTGNVPPYVIFPNAALQEMAYYLPRTTDSFARINGVGAAKLARYGEGFLSVVRTHVRLHGLPKRDVPSR